LGKCEEISGFRINEGLIFLLSHKINPYQDFGIFKGARQMINSAFI
jgi:hypothetical protein